MEKSLADTACKYISQLNIKKLVTKEQKEQAFNNCLLFSIKQNEKLVVLNNLNEVKGTASKKKEALVVVTKLAPMAGNTFRETSWIDDKLVFRDESFADVAKKMEHWHGVGISYNDKKLESIRLTGVFERETIGEALKALQIFVPFNFKVDQNNILITH